MHSVSEEGPSYLDDLENVFDRYRRMFIVGIYYMFLLWTQSFSFLYNLEVTSLWVIDLCILTSLAVVPCITFNTVALEGANSIYTDGIVRTIIGAKLAFVNI